MEYIIYCDESVKKGKYYSDFYGGALINASDFDNVVELLKTKANELNLFSEIKWNKVSENYLEKYKEMTTLFFKIISENKIKIRIMFSQNAEVPLNLSKENIENSFYMLYYQFIKHAFGLIYHKNKPKQKTYLRFYFDKLPDTNMKSETFKNFIFALQGLKKFREAKLKIRYENIIEIDSHKHIIQQCMDIVLGAIAFRLNNLHKEKQAGTNRRGKKTIAKHKLYQHILSLIKCLDNRKNFNIGVSTGFSSEQDIWNDTYRHWKFKPSVFFIDKTKYK